MIIVSACLVGINCRYDQKSYLHPLLEQEMARGCLLPLCPEQLGGLPTPRIPSEIQNGSARELLAERCKPDEERSVRIMNRAGKDVTSQFIKGSEEVARLAGIFHVKAAILKARSPSCGCGRIYDGAFRHCLVDGNGVTAELLLQRGVAVVTDEDVTPEKLEELKSL